MKILCIAGARPNFVAVAPVLVALRERPGVRALLLQTGQHQDDAMSDAFLRDLALPAPDFHLGVASGSPTEQMARVLVAFEQKLAEIAPDAVVVAGDASTTLACSLVVAKAFRADPASPGRFFRPALAHVEAGLRCPAPATPEDVNRIVTDRLSDFLFTSCEDASANLRNEGIPDDRIHFVGNVRIDALLACREKARRSAILRELGLEHAREIAPYAVLALHRPASVDDRETFVAILDALRTLAREVPILLPAHPRARRRIEEHRLAEHFVPARAQARPAPGDSRIRVLDPLGYLDFLHLMECSKLVVTDSGPIQEETTVLGVPCLTLRKHTERPVTVSQGTNVLVGFDPGKILIEGLRALKGWGRATRMPPFWDGHAARRIAEILADALAGRRA